MATCLNTQACIASLRWPLVESTHRQGGRSMAVARVTEIRASSPDGYQEAVIEGLKRASKTLRGVKGAWIKEQSVDVVEGKISGYKVDMLVTFVLEDPGVES